MATMGPGQLTCHRTIEPNDDRSARCVHDQAAVVIGQHIYDVAPVGAGHHNNSDQRAMSRGRLRTSSDRIRRSLGKDTTWQHPLAVSAPPNSQVRLSRPKQ
jgi:hypothetical protein